MSLLQDIVAAIEADDQQHTVTSLAADFRMSERTLQRLCKEYLGVGAKWILMRNRLLRTLEQAPLTNKASWTDIAAELNYSTQSHFTNDFKKLLGLSPRMYTKLVQGKE